MTSKITILIAVKNGADTLDRSFDSIFNQTYTDYSVLCINDFSTDNGKTAAILNNWKNKFENNQFTIINNDENLGLTRSLNKGLDSIDSTFTARIDADDWWHPEKLEKQIRFLEENNQIGIIGCNYVNVGFGKERKIILKETNQGIRQSIIKRNPFAHSCVAFRTKLIKELGGYDNLVKYGQDYELWLRCYPKTKYHNLQEFLCFRSTEKGISIERQKQQMWQGIKTQVKYIKEYGLPKKNYLHIFELLMLILIPDFIKRLKRKFVR